MRNIMRMYPEEKAAGLNRILAKMENVFLLADPPSAAEAEATAAAAAAQLSALAARPGTRGSVGAEVLDVELQRPLWSIM